MKTKKGVLSLIVLLIGGVIGDLRYGFFTKMGGDIYDYIQKIFVISELDDKDNDIIDDIADTLKNYPTVEQDFALFENPEYSGRYPKDFFETESYKNNRYTFETADKTIKVEFYQEDAAKYEDVVKKEYPDINEKALALATYLFEQDKKKLTNFTDDDLHLSKIVPESGFARCVVPGNSRKNPETAYFICRACNKDTVYTLRVRYYLGKNIKQDEKNPMNYLCESLYRGWSISGATKPIRSYDFYCRDIEVE